MGKSKNPNLCEPAILQNIAGIYFPLIFQIFPVEKIYIKFSASVNMKSDQNQRNVHVAHSFTPSAFDNIAQLKQVSSIIFHGLIISPFFTCFNCFLIISPEPLNSFYEKEQGKYNI
jgi:hypothetical protein